MSSTVGDTFDPHQPPRPIEPKPGDTAVVRYMHAYGYIFENPNWSTNVLYGFLCFMSSQIIPVVGQLLFMGYQFEVIESLHRHPSKTYPDFDFNKFSYYLQRSLWPFLVSLICVLPLFLIAMAAMGGGVLALIAVAGAMDKDGAPVVLIIGIPLIILVGIGILTVLSLPLQPIILRAGLAQDIGQAFKFGWAIDFLKKTWLELILFQLFLAVTGMPLVLLGYACCFIGVFASMAIFSLAQANMLCQLYELFLARGGEPIPLKPIYTAPATTV